MGKELKPLASAEIEDLETNGQEFYLLGGTLIGINILLMIFTVLYWTSSSFHEYLTGKPF